MKKLTAQECRNYIIGLVRSGALKIGETIATDGEIILSTGLYKHADGSINDEPEEVKENV